MNCRSTILVIFFVTYVSTQTPETKYETFGVERNFFQYFVGNGKLYTPSIYYQSYYDAFAMHVAIKCNDVDEIVCILARRTNFERQELQRIYSRLFKKSLVERMNRLKDPDFKTIMLNLLKDIPDYLIEELQFAVQLKDKTTLMQILVSIVEEELNKLVELYGKQVGRQLSEDIKTATQGEFRQILLCTIKDVRLPTPIIINLFGEEKQFFIDENKNYSITEARLLNGYLSKQPIDKNNITETFCEVDYFDLDEINTEYKRIYGESLEDAIQKKTSGFYKETLLAMMSSGRKRARLTAKWIHDALFSTPVNKRRLTRLLITRSEIDLYTVMIVYQEIYKTSLESDIKRRTEGLYKKTLLTLLGLNKKCPFTPK